MRKTFIAFSCVLFSVCAIAQATVPPDKLYGELFQDVQLAKIFPDSKTFVDCIPKRDPNKILADYKAIKNNPAVRFSLKLFVEENFIVPQQPASDYQTKEKDVVQHIKNLWTVLRRKSDSVISGSSLLPLPFDYIVPGGRFREIYYWDTYFTMLGLKESGEAELMKNMVKNFAHLVNQFGHIPNGNRSYYLSRSQPPFFSLMLELLAETKGKQVYSEYLEVLEKEYQYWMDETANTKHVFKMPDGNSLNRYWDQLTIPRQESFVEDYKIGNRLYPESAQAKYRHLRSAAESGWDFSSRWFADGKTLASIETTNIIPVDLNCLLHHTESLLSKMYATNGNGAKESFYLQRAAKRKAAIERYCWSAKNNWYVDYNIATKKQSTSLTLAGMVPFFLKLSNASKFSKAKLVLNKNFLKPGGVQTTLIKTGEQWDAPNGWAPLQWMTIIGLENYGDKILAKKIAGRWVAVNKKVFKETGKLMEKYDVVNAGREGGGGEYPSQDGFGWTNGVLLALINKYNLQ
ncbi:MAG TPA: alpha,alpha-trehalase TreA [Flavisolibacter sp.]